MSSRIEESKLAAQVDAFRQVRPVYELFGQILVAVFEQARRDLGFAAFVDARAKGIPNFAGKVVRKSHKYHDAVNQVTDLCGARVISETTGDIPRIKAFIRRNFLVDEANSEDTLERLKESEFSYRSVHFIVSLRPDVFADVIARVIASRSPGNSALQSALERQAARLFELRSEEESRRLRLPPGPVFKAEVQVRSLLQHAWASISHDRLYKTEIEVPKEIKREVHRVAALLEEADATFSRAVARIERFESYFGAYRDQERLRQETEIEKIVLAYDPDNTRQAARVSRLLATAGRWAELRVFLRPWIDRWKASPEGQHVLKASEGFAPEQGLDSGKISRFAANQFYASPVASDLLTDYGLTLMNNGEMSEGRHSLYHALLLCPTKVDDYVFLGDSFEGQKDAIAFSYYQAAFNQDPGNAWSLCRYLGKVIILQREEPAAGHFHAIIEQAIAHCQDQVLVNINLPHAWFNWAFLLLVDGHPAEALSVYTRAALACEPPARGRAANEIAPQPHDLQDCENHRILAGAIHFLEGILQSRAQMRMRELEGLDAAVRLLSLVRVVRFFDRDRRAAALAALRLQDFPHPDALSGQDVMIVAGTTAESEARTIENYREILQDAFRPFEGTLVCGGTTAGISGLVGDLSFDHPDRVQRVGCLPESLRGKVREHPAYECARTGGGGFSPLEAIQVWIELVARGVEPATVRVLGIGGGDISVVEYRLGVVLGANVGLLQLSGGTADATLKDGEWGPQPNLLSLPHDRETLKCFVVPPRKTQLFDDGTRDALAQKIHDQYRPKTLHEAVQDTPEQWEWEHLPENLKNSNRAVIDHIETKLKAVGCSLARCDPAKPLAFAFCPKQLEILAEIEHGRWMIERLLDGWKQSETRDTARKLRPNLVAWRDLPEGEKKKDRENVSQIPELLHRAGFKIVPSPAKPSAP